MSGTYVALNLTKFSADQLHLRLNLLKIPNLGPPDRLHSTIIYSPKKFPAENLPKSDLPILGSIIKWDLFDTSQVKDSDDKCLVAVLYSPGLQTLHEHCKKLGGEHTFDEYHPHITVSYKFNPKFNLDRLPVGLTVTFNPELIIEELKL